MKKIPRTSQNCIGSLLQAAREFGVETILLDEETQLRIFRKNGRDIFVKAHVPDLNSHIPTKVIGSKELTKKLLCQKNIPVPGGFKEKNINRALNRIKKGLVNYPLVVKPVEGSQGMAVSVDIRNEQDLRLAVEDVFRYNRRRKGRRNSFLVEECISGNDYRLLILDGKVIAASMRKPAYVIGDGKKTIRQLIEDYNSQPGVEKDQPLCPILIDRELERILDMSGLSLATVLPNKKQILLRKNANVSTGGRSFECLDKVHPGYREMAVKVATFFKLRFCSVDLICPDIRFFENFFVLEVNNAPGFDIHEVPYWGKPTPVGKYLVRAMFGLPLDLGMPLTPKKHFAKLGLTY